MSADDQTFDAALTGRMAARAAQVAYGRPLVTNVLRGLLVEAMVDEALGPAWTWCSTDYASWDFEHAQGLRLEVKQSAARQTWSPAGAAGAASFDSKARTGRWEGAEWVSSAGRAAHVYVFAHHPLTSDDADHRNERQWVFHVVATHRLPDTQRISLRGVQALALSCEFAELSAAVEAVRAGLAIVPSGSPNPSTQPGATL